MLSTVAPNESTENLSLLSTAAGGLDPVASLRPRAPSLSQPLGGLQVRERVSEAAAVPTESAFLNSQRLNEYTTAPMEMDPFIGQDPIRATPALQGAPSALASAVPIGNQTPPAAPKKMYVALELRPYNSY